MRFINTRTHGMLDYLFGTLLIVSPWLFGFVGRGAETSIPFILGAGVIVYSLFTNYELGVVRRLSMRGHLTLDAMGGLLLAVSPWLFGFAEEVYLPHLMLGLFDLGASFTTQTVPSYEHRGPMIG